MSAIAAHAACKTPVVFVGLDETAPASAVSPDDVAVIIRHHGQAALKAFTAGDLDEARAHWEAHRALQGQLDAPLADPGADPDELQTLAEILAADEVEPAERDGQRVNPPEGLRASSASLARTSPSPDTAPLEETAPAPELVAGAHRSKTAKGVETAKEGAGIGSRAPATGRRAQDSAYGVGASRSTKQEGQSELFTRGGARDPANGIRARDPANGVGARDPANGIRARDPGNGIGARVPANRSGAPPRPADSIDATKGTPSAAAVDARPPGDLPAADSVGGAIVAGDATQKGARQVASARGRSAAPPPRSDRSGAVSKVDPKAWLETEVRRILAEFGEDRALDLPDRFMSNVDRAVSDFTVGVRRKWFARALERMDKYLPEIHGIFSERRLPESFYYLALVESAFNPNAKSRAGAVGLWQFMPATARHYGLTVRWGLDERRDPKKATRAAREYLLDLILEFGDGHSMLLAMAAYNAGEGRVRNRLRRLRDYRNRSFWTLAERKLLPAETRRYVPTIIAAAVVGRNRARFNLNAPRPRRGVATLTLLRPVSIPYLLRVANMAEASLLALNPDLETGSGVTPADTRFRLVLPQAVARRLRSDPVLLTAQRAPKPRPAPVTSSPAERPGPKKKADRYLAYRVQRNDTWWTINEWSGVSQTKLRRDNPTVARGGLRPGQVVYLRDIPDGLMRYHHAVEPGETVSSIAALYGVASKHLQQWNGLGHRPIRAGQPLVVYARRAPPSRVPARPQRVVYKVRAQDTWWKISRWSGIEPDQLRRDNPQAASVGLRPGQQVFLQDPNLRQAEHVVRTGETLAQLALKYGVRADDLSRWNNVSAAALRPGQRLVVYTRLSVSAGQRQ